MYSDEKNKRAKLDKLLTDYNNNRYRIRFTDRKGNRNSIGLNVTWQEAITIANTIQRNIILNDLTSARYSSKHHKLDRQRLKGRCIFIPN